MMKTGGTGMSLINEKIMKKFSEWAEENADENVFPVISKEGESYFIERNSEETYMMEYSFRTLAELKKVLEEYSGLSADPVMLKMMTIEICQDRYKSELNTYTGEDNDQEEKKAQDSEKTLPEFVYVF